MGRSSSRMLVFPFLILMCVPALALNVVPSSATIQENATLQFKASVPSTWTTTCGTITSAGLFKAPLYPSTTCTVKATATDGSGTATASLTIVSPIVMTPVSATTAPGQTQQFTASAPVTWSAKCGTITAGGLFTATAAIGTSCTIEGVATVTPKFTVYGSDKVGTSTVFAISPLNPTVQEGATVQFKTNGSPTYTVSCGTISAGGLYTAPLAPGPCKVTAKSLSGNLASTTITVATPLAITPTVVATPAGLTQQFNASASVTWTASCGVITATGLFTASANSGSTCTIQATATTGTAYTASVVDMIAVGPALTISPPSVTLSEASTQQFSANVRAMWTATCGSIGTTTGLYVAPLAAERCMVTGTPVYGGAAVSAAVSVTSPLNITPTSAATPNGQTQQFSANIPVTWASSCGGINGTSGLFSASATEGTVCSITATSTGAPAYSAMVTDAIGPSGLFAVTPLQPSLVENQTQQFSAGAPATWTATCGSISATSGLFSAPLSAGVCSVTAVATDGSGTTASANVSVTSPITLTPAAANLHALNTITFAANSPVTWTSSCGSISSTGVFTAPAAAGPCTITATATGVTAFRAQATVGVDIVNQVRWRNSSQGTGLQSDELVLTPANVNASNMAQAWTATVDGGVWAEPLYMNGVTINGVPHNVLYVATDNDSVYALDADSGIQLWMTSLIPPGATAVAGTMVGDAYIPSIGVLGTPVIDDNVIYVVAETAEQNATYFPHRLHALDITTGGELFGGPVLASDPGLQPIKKLQRPGLTIANGNVYVAFGSMADTLPYNGVLLAFNETTLAETASWVSTPTGSEGGIWQAGGAPSVDSAGNVYVLTGNGTADGVTNFGQSAVKLNPGLQVLDFFTPYNAVTLNASDLDLGSASVPVMPDQNGQFPHELIFCGKYPTVYVVNRDSLGGYNTTTDNIVQELPNAVGGTATTRDSGQACFTSPSAWGGNIYFAANGDVLKQFTLNPNTGLLSTTPLYKGAFAYGWPGSQSLISSNGNTNGIIWTFDNVAKKVHADSASNVSIPLWISPAINTGYLKWTTPTVINGHVYVGGQGTVVAFAPLH